MGIEHEARAAPVAIDDSAQCRGARSMLRLGGQVRQPNAGGQSASIAAEALCDLYGRRSRSGEAQDVAVKEDVHRDRRPSTVEEAEIRRIMEGEKPRGRERAFELPYRPALVFLFELAIESAMRMREMYTLELSQFDVERRTAALERTKNGSKRAVPLTTVAVGAFESYVAAVNGLDPDMGGFAFDSGRLFPWIDEVEAGMRAKSMPP